MSAVLTSLRRWFTEPPAADVAIAFSPRAICAARAETQRNGRALAAVAIEPLPEGALRPRIDHPGFQEPEALREALRRSLTRAGIRSGESVAAVVPDGCVRFRLFSRHEVPPDAPDRDEQVRFRVRKLLPGEVGEARVVACWPPRGVESVSGAFGVGGTAAILDAYEHALGAFGLDCGALEPALVTALDDLARECASGDALLVRHDPSSVSLAVLRDGWPVVVRSFGADVAASPDETAREVAATAAFWRERLGGRSLARAQVEAAAPEFDSVAAAVRAAFSAEAMPAACPRGLSATGVPDAIVRAAAPALSLLARGTGRNR